MFGQQERERNGILFSCVFVLEKKETLKIFISHMFECPLSCPPTDEMSPSQILPADSIWGKLKFSLENFLSNTLFHANQSRPLKENQLHTSLMEKPMLCVGAHKAQSVHCCRSVHMHYLVTCVYILPTLMDTAISIDQVGSALSRERKLTELTRSHTPTTRPRNCSLWTCSTRGFGGKVGSGIWSFAFPPRH